jgi:hypothetical protein
MGKWEYSSTIDFSTRSRSAVSFTLSLFYPHGNCPQYPLEEKLGGPQNQSQRCGEEKTLLPLLEIEHRLPTCSPTLCQLSYNYVAKSFHCSVNSCSSNQDILCFIEHKWSSPGPKFDDMTSFFPRILCDSLQYINPGDKLLVTEM